MKIFIIPILLCISLTAYGQQYTYGQPISGSNIGQSYYHDSELVIKPNFSSTLGFSATIKPFTLPSVLEIGRRAIITHTVRKPGFSSSPIIAAATSAVNRTYSFLDGFDRVSQTVIKDFNLGLDLVKPESYAFSATEKNDYLPYTVTYNGSSYRATALNGSNGYEDSEQRIYYTLPPSNVAGVGNNGNAFSTVRFEDFGGRPLETSLPGEDHKIGSGHTLRNNYSLLEEEEHIKKWTVTSNGISTSSDYHPVVDAIRKVSTIDGDGHTTIVYRDPDDRVLAVTKMLGIIPLTTYYVYDAMNRLVYVIPPLPRAIGLPSSISSLDAVFKSFVYAYKYDKHSRVIEKHVPSKGWTSMVYNKVNRLVLTQDAVQKEEHSWTFVKYDVGGRPVYNGIYSSNATREVLQEAANSFNGSHHEISTPLQGMGYSDNSFPVISTAAGSDVLSYNYYDNYKTLSNTAINNATATDIFNQNEVDTILKVPSGMSTITLKKVVGTNDYLLSVAYYNMEGRLVKTAVQNYYANKKHLANYDVTINTYNFDGTLAKTLETQSVAAIAPFVTTVETVNRYDHQGRLIEIGQRVNGGTNILVEQNEYNALGQVYRKKLHSANNGQKFLQNVNYKYEIGGQLKSINNPETLTDEDNPSKSDVFAFELFRSKIGNTGATPTYNGNISAVSWQTKVPSPLATNINQEKKIFSYRYDELDRLLEAKFSTATITNSFREQIEYDDSGNITSLLRNGKNGDIINNLSYDYGYQGVLKQQLESLSDSGSENISAEYVYDAIGRVKSDSYKQANDISYNKVGMVSTVALSGDRSIAYLYDGEGIKLYQEVNAGGGVDKKYYVNGSEYDSSGNLLFIRTFFGRIVPKGDGSFTYEYFIKDHLGNFRGIYADRNGNHEVDAEEVSDISDYYPFGRRLDYGSSYIINPLNNYGFGEKEKQPISGFLDFHARQYDANIGRWLSVDPLAERFYSWACYNYVLNNPINMIDKDGRYAVSVHYNITYKTLLSLGYSKKEADLFAHYSSTYADHPPAIAGLLDFALHPLETRTHHKRIGIDYSKTEESQLEKNSHWHSMMSDAEAKAGMTERQALFRGLKFGWDNVFASKGSNLEKYGQGIHALQDAIAHRGARTSDHIGINLPSSAMFYNDLYGSTKDAEALTRSAAIVAGLMAGRKVKFEKDEVMNFQGMSGDQLESAIKLLLNVGYTGTIYFEQQ